MHMHALVRATSKLDKSNAGDSRGKPVIPIELGEVNGCLPINVQNKKFVVPDGRIATYAFAQPLPPPQYHWQISHDHVGFLPNSSMVTHDGLAKDMPQAVALPINSIQRVKGFFQFQAEKIYTNSVTTSCFNSTGILHETDGNKEIPSRHSVNNGNYKASINTQSPGCSDPHAQREYSDVPKRKEPVLYGKGLSENKLTSTEHSTCDQNQTFSITKSIQEGSSSCQSPTVTVAVPGLKSRKRAAKQSTITDRLRRARIAENVESLQGLLPQSDKGKKEAVMEDIVNYVKYLKLQVKILSQSRLGGEATDTPFIHLEGFGHYLPNQQMLNEPLEEILGQMMELDKSAVAQLLEAKGLYVIPMSLAKGFSG